MGALGQVLQTYGELFSPRLWDLVFNGVLFPLFDDVRHVDEEQGETEWIQTSCGPAMKKLNALFVKFFPALAGLLPGLLTLLGQCIAHQNEGVAQIGVTSIKVRTSRELLLDITARIPRAEEAREGKTFSEGRKQFEHVF